MKKIFPIISILILFTACMKDIPQEDINQKKQEQQEVQRERGSNDHEGMGMDE